MSVIGAFLPVSRSLTFYCVAVSYGFPNATLVQSLRDRIGNKEKKRKKRERERPSIDSLSPPLSFSLFLSLEGRISRSRGHEKDKVERIEMAANEKERKEEGTCSDILREQ